MHEIWQDTVESMYKHVCEVICRSTVKDIFTLQHRLSVLKRAEAGAEALGRRQRHSSAQIICREKGQKSVWKLVRSALLRTTLLFQHRLSVLSYLSVRK